MVGFNEETEMLIEQLVRGHRQLDVISIFGMLGLGKTTLAKKFYDHEAISNRFDIRLWCCSSQSYNNRALLFELLGHICEIDDFIKEKSDDELAEKLYRYLKGKRYLIVEDDVWSPNAWDDIERPFPDDNKGSRIILTTRLESIATYAMINSSPHHLRLFTEEESWMLLKEKVFKEDNYYPQQLEDIGKQIATKCGGLPLAIVLVAGVLANNDKEVIHWQQVRERLKLKMQGCMDIVESSYQHLPVHLQNCFLYFGSFLEGEKVPVQKLIRLWIAENFVEASSTTLKSLEMVAMDYLMDLIRSNLVMVANINSSGELKAVYIHDVIHEFSLRKAKVGNFLLRINDRLSLWTHIYLSTFRMKYQHLKDGEFSNLKVLKLKKLGLSEWTASDDSYPNLEQVLVHGCWKLEEIPYSFGSSCSMQLIEVRSCCDSAVNAALKIKETQIEEMGNSEFKVIICK